MVGGRAGPRSGGGTSSWVTPESKMGLLRGPVTASDGIQEIVVTAASTRMCRSCRELVRMGTVTAPDDTTTGTITVFLADDNILVREGVRALLDLAPDLEVVGTAEDYDSLVAGADPGRARRGDHRHPHASRLPGRGHRRGQGGAQAPSGHRHRHPLPVRRPRVRHLAARRGLGRLRLPAQGPGGRRQPPRRRHPGRGHRRLGARPRDRRGPGRPRPGRGRALVAGGRPAPPHRRRAHRSRPSPRPGTLPRRRSATPSTPSS